MIHKAYVAGEVTLRGRHISFECYVSRGNTPQPVIVVAGDEKTAKKWYEKIIAAKGKKHIWLMDGEWPDGEIPMFFKFSDAIYRPKVRFDAEEEAERGMGYY